MRVIKASFLKLANPLFYLPLSLLIVIRILYSTYNYLNESGGTIMISYPLMAGLSILSSLLGFLFFKKYRRSGRPVWFVLGMVSSFVLPGLIFYIFLKLEQWDLNLLKYSEKLKVGDVGCYFYTYSVFHRPESPSFDRLRREKFAEYSSVLPPHVSQKIKI